MLTQVIDCDTISFLIYFSFWILYLHKTVLSKFLNVYFFTLHISGWISRWVSQQRILFFTFWLYSLVDAIIWFCNRVMLNREKNVAFQTSLFYQMCVPDMLFCKSSTIAYTILYTNYDFGKKNVHIYNCLINYSHEKCHGRKIKNHMFLINSSLWPFTNFWSSLSVSPKMHSYGTPLQIKSHIHGRCHNKLVGTYMSFAQLVYCWLDVFYDV